ncbi:MAG: hypothetical protein ACXIUM_02220 [Wenzhouxiangella sp.]
MRPAHWTLGQLLRLSAGLFIWCSAFVVLYGGLSLGCQNLDIPAEAGVMNGLSLGLILAVLAHVGALIALLVQHQRRPVKAGAGEEERSRIMRQRVEGLVLWISLAGLLFIAFPVLMVPPCAG